MADVIGQFKRVRDDVLTKFADFGAYHAEVVTVEPRDAVTGAVVTIDTIHHEVHEGEMFHAEHVATTVANNASLDLLINPGAVDQHLALSVTAGGACRVYVYENPTASGGTAVPVYNMLRSSANPTLATVAHTPTVTATGSTAIVPGRYVPGGASAQTRVGGTIRTGTEWIYKASTPYLVRITNVSGQAVFVDAALEWYAE